MLVDQSRWVSLAILVAVTAAIDFIYLVPHRGTLPLKFLVPGTVFLLAFQIVPIVYTIEVALSNYSTGHIISKADAIQQIKINSLQQPENGKQYEAAPARDENGKLVLILRDDTSGAVYVGTKGSLRPLPKSSVKVDPATSIPTAATGYTLIKGAELFSLDQQLATFVIPTTGDAAIRPQGVHNAVELRPTLRYDAAHDRFVRISDGAGLPRQRQGRVRRREQPEGRARARLEGVHGLGELPQADVEPAVPRPVRPRLHLDARLRDAHRLPLVRDRPLPRDRARQERACASRSSTARCSSSRTRCRASSRCSSGAGS